MPSRFTGYAGTPVNKGVRGGVRCTRTFHFASICFHSSVIWVSRSDVQDRLSRNKTVTVFWKALSVLAQTLTVFRQDSCSRKRDCCLRHSIRRNPMLIDANGCTCDGKWRECEGANRRKCLCTKGLWNVTAFFWKASGARGARVRARQLVDSDKNQKNPFALIETASPTVCLHASPCERAHSVSLQPHRQSPRGFNQCKSKNRKNVYPAWWVKSGLKMFGRMAECFLA